MKVITVDEYLKMNKFQRKLVDIRNAAYRKVKWVKDHPEETLAAVGTAAAALGVINKVVRPMVRTHNLNKERNLKDRYVYDRSLGMYLHTKRKLTNRDFVTINARRKNGQKLADILEDMNLLD